MASKSSATLWLTLWALSASTPVLACPHWQFTGPFTIHQSNRIEVHGEFIQSGRQLGGRASFYSPTLGDGGTTLAGEIEGRIDGDQIELDVYWYGSYEECGPGECYGSSYDAGARYLGRIDANGRVSGINFETDRPQARVNWQLADAVACVAPPPTLEDYVRETGPIAPPDVRGARVQEPGGFARPDVQGAKVREPGGFAPYNPERAAAGNQSSLRKSAVRQALSQSLSARREGEQR